MTRHNKSINILLITVGLISCICDAFLGSSVHHGRVHPSLTEFSEAYDGIGFNLGLDIPHDITSRLDTQSRLSIHGISVQLQNLPAESSSIVMLPGCNGPNPRLSTGPLSTCVQSHGKFISMNGMQQVQLDSGCWEMVWLENKPAGSVVLGFDIAHDATRNGAKLPSGHIFLSFPVFTQETLDIAKAKKLRHETSFLKYSTLQDEELGKMRMTKNLFQKAIHFRNAVSANEKASLMRTNAYQNVPTDDDDIISIGDDLKLCTNGIVYHSGPSDKETNDKGNYTQIGYASLKKMM